MTRNTLRGYFNFTLPDGLVIVACAYHRIDGRAWVNWPSVDVDFVDLDARQRFQEMALEAAREVFPDEAAS
jgi:hypothetical protein